MAIAARLARKSLEAQEEQRRQQEELERKRVEHIRTSVVPAIISQCEAAAERGQESAQFSVRVDYQLFAGHGETVTREVQAALGAAGFTDPSCSLVTRHQGSSWSAHAMVSIVEGSVSWDQAVAEAKMSDVHVRPEEPETRGNVRVSCGICQEEGTAVCLSPCGHLICSRCAKNTIEACPFCRTYVLTVQPIFEP